MGKTDRYTIQVDKSTEKQTDIYNIVWFIYKFKELLVSINTISREFGPRYTVVEVPDTPFQLKMCFLGENIKLVEFYYLASLASTSTVSMNLSLEVWFGSLKENFAKDCGTVQANEWQHCATFKDPDSKDNDKHRIDIDGHLQLTFKFKMGPAVNSPQLSDDFGTLLNDATFSDVTMKSAEGIEFRAHKIVLAVRSEVLRAHFEHNMRENITNVVETSWESEVLRGVLTYVYTDKAPRVDDAPDKLLAAADYYQLMGLKSLCEEALYKRLTVENAVETLQLAELHSANSLKQSTLGFIKNGRADLVTETEGWANIQSVEILKKMYTFVTNPKICGVDVLATEFAKLCKK